MNKKILIFLMSLIILCSNASQAKETEIDPYNIFPKVKLETSMGNIIVELDRTKAPITVNNFLTYVVNGEYDNTIFHRVLADFIVQGGGYDPNFTIKKVNNNIINESGNGLKNEMGTIAMAKESKPHTANRQFFFNVKDNTNLDPGRRWGYAVFGNITEGLEVIESMAKVETDFNAEMSWSDVPVKPIILIKATLLAAE
ncbi:peptidylprolyl isomerase [Pseudocolwellia sp. AS88]|uniref:peptidylprolyl isomerase n=1 Tax=Pseudocolwellia sp. AS88 TaxID=3063958 RepID=UPI0026E9A857|nr:peptidylprolyl isomerase [Pseudocolwellia sp. AS88]MDO7085865.1 peptidylprolyl isomerase [Pseudocolwellia sp. AS88]